MKNGVGLMLGLFLIAVSAGADDGVLRAAKGTYVNSGLFGNASLDLRVSDEESTIDYRARTGDYCRGKLRSASNGELQALGFSYIDESVCVYFVDGDCASSVTTPGTLLYPDVVLLSVISDSGKYAVRLNEFQWIFERRHWYSKKQKVLFPILQTFLELSK